jgi:hypothetical protein
MEFNAAPRVKEFKRDLVAFIIKTAFDFVPRFDNQLARANGSGGGGGGGGGARAGRAALAAAHPPPTLSDAHARGLAQVDGLVKWTDSNHQCILFQLAGAERDEEMDSGGCGAHPFQSA